MFLKREKNMKKINQVQVLMVMMTMTMSAKSPRTKQAHRK